MRALVDVDGQVCDTITLDTLYRGSMPRVGPMETWNQLKADGDDLAILHMGSGKEGQIRVLHLEDFALAETYQDEEQQLINFIVNHRAQIGINLFQKAGLVHREIEYYRNFSNRLVHYMLPNIDLSIDISYAYLTFTDKGWELLLNGSQQYLFLAKWNDVVMLTELISNLSRPIQSLEVQLALINPKDITDRYKAVTYYKAMFNSRLEEIQLEEFDSYIKTCINKDTVYASKMPCMTGANLLLPPICTNIDISLELPFGQREEAMREVEEKALQMGVYLLWAEPSTQMAYQLDTELTKVFGLLVKNEEFFYDNTDLFFQWDIFRRSLLRHALNIGTKERFDMKRIRSFFGSGLKNSSEIQSRQEADTLKRE